VPDRATLARRRLEQMLEPAPLPRLIPRAPAPSPSRSAGPAIHDLRVATQHWQAGRLDEAAAICERVLAVTPNHDGALHLLGVVVAQQGHPEAALELIGRALVLRPGSAEYHTNRGNCLQALGRLDEAVAAHRRAITINPRLASACLNLGSTLYELGALDAAEAANRHALALDRTLVEPLQNLAVISLARGDYLRGWPELETYCRATGFAHDFHHGPRWVASCPRWSGEDLGGLTIALHCEHGVGDTFQVVRFATLVKARGARTVMCCDDQLAPILSTADGLDEVRPWSAGAMRCDWRAPLYSVPAFVGTSMDTLPRKVPYLHPDAALVERWRERLAGISGFRVGIVWAGTPQFLHDPWRRRAIPLREFEPLARIPGVSLISLQVQYGLDQLPGAGFPIVDLGPALTATPGAFIDAAAVVANLDLVVSVDTGFAHFAGALGARTWTVLPRASCWRWMLDRTDSPWYPTMRLFRQNRPGDWASVVQRIATELRCVSCV
jgi:Flp pilus assembly protein TadD